MNVHQSQQYSLLSKEERSSEDDTNTSDDMSLTEHDFRKPSRARRIARTCALQLGILTIYTALLLGVARGVFHKSWSATWAQDAPFSAMKDAVTFNVREVGYNFEDINPFKGQPVADIDQEWDQLLNRPHDMALPAEDVHRLNRTSIEFVTGSHAGKVLAQPLTFHMLHCLYNIYKYNHLDFYGMDAGGPEWIVKHTDHCIDNLRQFVQCHASTGISTFKWLDDRKTAWPVLNSQEICVDWDYYNGWVQSNSMTMQETRTLMTEDGEPMFHHPRFGGISIKDYQEADEKLHHGGHGLG